MIAPSLRPCTKKVRRRPSPGSALLSGLLLVLLFVPGAVAATEPPNIVVILSDDMGFSDIGCYGGEIETPHLDRLADGGLRFTQFYNTGRCCPTRASLLTGIYPHQAGVGWMMQDNGHDGYRGNLNRRCATIPEVLETAGYASYAAGKWHVTRHTRPEGPKHNWPLQRGFDRFYGTITGAGSFFDPGTLTRDNTMISPFADPEYTPDVYYYTDAISDHAVRFIDEHEASDPDRPFFLYVAYTAAHWPMHALPEDIAEYEGRYDDGYRAVRRARFRRLKELGLIDPGWDLSPREGDWEAFPHRGWEARCMEVYAAMIDRMDRGIGQIVATLEEHGELDNTLLLYLQDNGGCQEGVGRRGDGQRPAEATRPPIAEDAIRRAVIPKQDRAGVPTLMGPGVMPGPGDTYIAYGRNWANVSNTPFREYKHFVHEGGIATPLIAHWPKGIRRHGEIERQPGHLVDILATCVDLAGAEYPERRAGHAIRPPEGVSLAPAFAGEPLDRSGPIFWEHEGNRAVRDGRWKLVAKGARGAWELYDMETDRTEMHDLADERPELAARLAERWEAWADRANVYPLVPWRTARRPLSEKTRFELDPDADLPRHDAPNVAERAFRARAVIVGGGRQGVLVAQGGTAHGWSLHLRGGRPVFAVRREGKLTAVRADEPLPEGTREVAVRLEAGGRVEIRVDGETAAEGRVAGTLTSMPAEGLQVGQDRGGAVADYEAPFAFDGEIESVRVALAEE